MPHPTRAPIESTKRLNGYVWLISFFTGAVVMGVFTLVAEQPTFISPDSVTYLDWSPVRTPFYPLFLSVVKDFDAGFGSLPYLQMGLLVGATAFLAQAAVRLGGPWWLWVLMSAGALGNPFVWRYAWEMQTESPFIALVLVLLACIAMALPRRPEGLAWLCAASVALGSAILVRPVGYALFGVAVGAAYVWRHRRFTALLASALPAVVMLTAVCGWNLVSKGYFGTQLFGGYNIVGQVAFLITPDVETNDPALQKAIRRIAGDLANVRERLPQDFASWQKYFLMKQYAYNTALNGYILPAIAEAMDSPNAPSLSPVASAKRTNALAWSVAAAAIRHRPGGYIYDVITNFVGLWTLPGVSSASNAGALQNELCSTAFRGFYCNDGKADVVRIQIPAPLVPLKDGLFFGMMLLSFVLIVTVALRPMSSPLLVLAAMAALCINTHHFLVALLETGLPRYAMAMWPMLVVMTAASAAWLVSRQDRSGLARSPEIIARVPVHATAE